MKLKLYDLGLSRDIQEYWDKIGYDPTPEEWSMIIMNISRQPEYMKNIHLENLLKYYTLNSKYKNYCIEYLESFSSSVKNFKHLNEDQIFMMIDDYSEYPIALSKDYDSIEAITKENEAKQIYVGNKFRIIKSKLYNTGISDYNVIDEYIIFDENHNIVDYMLNNVIEFPWEDVKFPTDFTSKDIFKYCYNDGLFDQYLYICLNCDGHTTFETDSSSGNGIKSFIYNPLKDSLCYDHSSPIFFERLDPSEYGIYPIYKELEECGGDGEKLKILIENRKEIQRE